jgi:hypothetical protein
LDTKAQLYLRKIVFCKREREKKEMIFGIPRKGSLHRGKSTSFLWDW